MLVTCGVTLLCLCRMWMCRSLSFPPCRDKGNVCVCVCAQGYYLMSILALSTLYGARALTYPPSHALASTEGREDLAGDTLEGGSELESSRESRADPVEPCHGTEPWAVTAGPFGDGEWPGADTGCGVIPNPEAILGFAGRELSLCPAGCGMRQCPGMQRVLAVCWLLPCSQCCHVEMCQCSDPWMSPCHPSHAATLKATPVQCPCVQAMWLEGQHSSR